MKNTTDMRETAGKAMHTIADSSKKAALAAVGAPVVAGKRIAGATGRITKGANKTFESWVAEGERVTEQLRETKMVGEIKERVDFEQLQGRVEKLRDQLEEVLSSWRESFMPEKTATVPAEKEVEPAAPAKKPGSNKTAAKKTAAAKDTETTS